MFGMGQICSDRGKWDQVRVVGRAVEDGGYKMWQTEEAKCMGGGGEEC